MSYDTYGHTPSHKAFDLLDVYGIAYDEERAARKKVRLAIIGVGGVAQSKYFPAIARLRMIWEPIEIVAFVEPREADARKVQSVYGGKWYADYRQMLVEEKPDGLLVLSPDHLHAEHTIAGLEAGCHVLVEKPISRSLVDARLMCEAADAAKRTLMTVATMRYSPPYRRAKQFIERGPVSNPAMYVGKFNLGYDYVDLFESGTIHLFDLTRYFMGDVATVNAVGVNRYEKNRRRYPIDNAIATFEFVSGAVGTIYTSASALSFKPWMRVEIYGDKVWLAVDDQSELILYDSEEGPAQSWKPIVPNTLLFDEEFGGFMGIVENFAQVIRGQETPVVTGWDGYRAYELKTATQLSLARKEKVTLPLDDLAAADAEVLAWLQANGWPGE
ncbi:MAG: Gfo/Idh/MocA family oxidoreductase [Burkholderiales bacterium]|nr:Gfo/Idh/MocA family oxidoreductase [Anaerolineae bacterium]